MMTLTPAYGRDYKYKRDAMKDFYADKDFILNDVSSQWDGKPINKSQIEVGTFITLRFAKMVKIHAFKLEKGE